MTITKEQYSLFGEILVEVLLKLNYVGKIVGYKNESDKVIFQVKLDGNLDMLYPLVEEDADDICEMMNSAVNIGLRKFDGNLEMRFPDVTVFMANAILRYNPKLEF